MIRVYNGEGSSRTGSQLLVKRFAMSGLRATYINETEIQSGLDLEETKLLVFSSLSVTGFKKGLGETGTNNIKSYVEQGGHYLGICAGGYFGAEEIYFKGKDYLTQEPYQKQAEGLGFFKGVAIGSLTEITNTAFTGMTDSAAVIQLTTLNNNCFDSLYWGGGRFITEADNETPVKILSLYQPPRQSRPFVMGVQCDVGSQQGKATLLGYHPEVGKNDLRNWILPIEDLSEHTHRIFQQAFSNNTPTNIDNSFDILLGQIGLKEMIKPVAKPHPLFPNALNLTR